MIEPRDLCARDVMTASPETLTAVTPVRQAAARLVERRVSAVPVVGPDGRLEGLFTGQRLFGDLVRLLEPRAASEAGEWILELGRRPVSARTEAAGTCEPAAPLERVCQEMVRTRAHRRVVVDGGCVIGMLSAIDAVRALACIAALESEADPALGDLCARDLRVADVMTPLPDVLDADRTLAEAGGLLARQRRVSGLPVVDRGGRALGVLSFRDLLVRLEPLLRTGARLDAAELQGLGATRVREHLLRPAAVCRPEEHLGDACQRMVRERVHRLVVVESSRRVTGILSAIDVVRALACLAALARPWGRGGEEAGT